MELGVVGEGTGARRLRSLSILRVIECMVSSRRAKESSRLWETIRTNESIKCYEQNIMQEIKELASRHQNLQRKKKSREESNLLISFMPDAIIT